MFHVFQKLARTRRAGLAFCCGFFFHSHPIALGANPQRSCFLSRGFCIHRRLRQSRQARWRLARLVDSATIPLFQRSGALKGRSTSEIHACARCVALSTTD